MGSHPGFVASRLAYPSFDVLADDGIAVDEGQHVAAGLPGPEIAGVRGTSLEWISSGDIDLPAPERFLALRHHRARSVPYEHGDSDRLVGSPPTPA
jgi:hypothetical protein